MVKFELKISSGNAAITEETNYAIADILRKTADKVADWATDGLLHDANGNNVGSWWLEKDGE